MNSELSLQEEINIYTSSNLTPSEVFIIRLLFLAQDGEPKHLNNYLSNVPDGKGLFKKVLVSLQNKKVILASFKIPKEGESIRLNDIPFNKNFLKKYVRESNQLGKELFDKYPDIMFINGNRAMIKNFTKAGLYSLDEFCLYYAKQIKASSASHERVMSALEFGIENNLIRFTILEFIASRKWEFLERLRDTGDFAGYDNTILL